ncbi:MAG: Uma2 family endonuclease [Chloroflexi bacterium]|nr:Uma2 family endonuclease [Chloroflexota bacterium]
MAVEQRLYTVQEFEAFLARPENSERRFELIHGEIVEKMPIHEHGVITLKFGSKILTFVEEHNLGHVGVEMRHRPADDPHNDRLPDIAFTRDASKALVKKGAVLVMPDLVVAVQSPDDSWRKLREKARFYLANGTRLVWLVFPQQRLVEVYTPDDEYTVTENEVLDGLDVLPGFTLAVRDIFPKQV